MSYLDELNEVQRAAVVNTDGPSLIIAGPGSGKTRVLTYRIAHLIQQGVDPFSILALTFTNKAAEEMKRRIEKISGSAGRGLFMGTFHSIFARILRVEATRLGYPANFTIYDTEDSKSVIKAIVKEMGLDDKLYKPNQVLYRISAAKNALITHMQYGNDPELLAEDREARQPQRHSIYKAYTERCFKSGAMDFDDLLLITYQLFEQFPEVLHKYQYKFRYLLIDEFQDTNYLQYAIVKRIGDVFQNITVVGDDAQSIYAFRGATIDNILNFEREYPEMKVFKLEQNYRSTRHIVQAAHSLIQKNKGQLKKEIWTSNPEGHPIRVMKLASDNEEGRWVADSIQELRLREQKKNSDFAILYRTNAQSRAFEEALRRQGIAYRIYGGMSFYQRKEIKDLLAYLKLSINPNDEEALKRVINYPARGIGQSTVDKLLIYASQTGKTMWEVVEQVQFFDFPARTRNLLEEFGLMIKSFGAQAQTKNAFDLASHIARTSRLLAELSVDKTVEGVSRYENIQELLNSIKEFVEEDTVQPGEEADIAPDRSLGSFLQNISLLTGDEKEGSQEDAVKLMTIHAAKGLEFPVVYVVGLEENLFPSSQSLYSTEDLEEERRLFYVAITRAETSLFLTYATTRYKFGSLNYCDPSRFISELPASSLSGVEGGAPTVVKKLSFQSPRPIAKPYTASAAAESFVPDDVAALQTGMEVVHEKFGEGKVISMDGSGPNRIASIHFGQFGIKKIMLKFARLMIKK